MQRIKWTFIVIIICLDIQLIHGQEKQFMYDGQMRSYIVYEPSLESNPNGHPLVIGLHGTGADGPTFMATASLAQKANNEKFFVACPNALLHNLFTYFNAGGGFEELTNGTDDIGFILALIDTMISNYNIDTTRIYVMGFSNGSAMSYRVAAELSHKIAAIGAVSGQMVYEYCNPEFPVPIIHFHGLSDNLIPYEGNGDNIPSVESVMEIWRGINGCIPIHETIYDENGILGKKWASFDGKGDLMLYTIQDQEHEWPRTGTLGISATDVIWDFVELQTRGSTTQIEQDGDLSALRNFNLFPNFPNPFNPETTIRYALPKEAAVRLTIFNLYGQVVKTLVDQQESAGYKSVVWNATDRYGNAVSSGIYFYVLETDQGYGKSSKMVLLK